MTARRALVAVALALVAAGCWWMLRSAPAVERAPAPPRETPPHRARSHVAPPPEPATPDPAHPWRVVVRVVRATDGVPVADADVVVGGRGGDAMHEARTDAAGVAKFAAESGPSDVMVVVRAQGFVRGVLGCLFERIEVKKGVATDVVVELDAAGAMEGVVLEEDGRPLAGARFVVDGFSVHFDTEPPVAQTTSGADGRFRLDGLDLRGGSRVRVSAPRHVLTHVAWKPASAKSVEIRLTTGARIVGVVTDPSGAPVANATVRAWTTNAGSVAMDEVPAEPETTTDADGRYAIEYLPFGATWSVQATKSGFGDSDAAHGLAPDAAQREVARDLALKPLGRVDVSIVTTDATPVVLADVVVETAAGRQETRARHTYPSFAVDVTSFPACSIGVDVRGFPPKSVDLTLAPGERRKIEIRLDADAPIAGVVADDLGRPLAGAKIETNVRDAWKFGTVDRSAVSDAAGAFRLVGITAGRYGLTASAEGHEVVRGVLADAPSDGLRIALRRRGSLSLTLRVPADAAKPESVTVAVGRPDTPSRDVHAFDWTDAPIVLPVDPGPWRVEVEAAGFDKAARAADVAPGEQATIGLVVFGDGVRALGRVVDREKRAVVGAHVAVGGTSADTDALGWFLITHVAAGRCRVVVTTRDGRPIEERDVELRRGDETPIDFTVER
jgi:hypothetical protein